MNSLNLAHRLTAGAWARGWRGLLSVLLIAAAATVARPLAAAELPAPVPAVKPAPPAAPIVAPAPAPAAVAPADPAAPPLVVAVCVTTAPARYARVLRAGAAKAAADGHATLVWQVLEAGGGRDQLTQAEAAVTAGAKVVVVDPVDARFFAAWNRRQRHPDVPLVMLNVPACPDGATAMVTTDPAAMGKRGAVQLATEIGGMGSVMLLRYAIGAPVIAQREQGFLAQVKAVPQMVVASSDVYAGATPEEAAKSVAPVLMRLRDLDGIFCPNDITTLGLLTALRTDGRLGQIKVVGCDAGTVQLQALKDGDLQALVVEDVYKIGYEAVRVGLAALAGAAVEPQVVVPAVLVTRETLQSPPVQAVIATWQDPPTAAAKPAAAPPPAPGQ